MKFNKSKCKFNKSKVNFLGHEITSLGVKPDYNKIKTIKELKQPENKEVLQRILGVVNYVGRFLPNVAQINAPIRYQPYLLFTFDNVFIIQLSVFEKNKKIAH